MISRFRARALLAVAAAILAVHAPRLALAADEPRTPKSNKTSDDSAWSVQPTWKETFGSKKYVGTYLDLAIGGDLRVTPSYNTYHSAAVTGTYRTFGLRIDYDLGDYAFAVTAGISPTNDNYRNHSAGGEFSRHFDFENTEGDFIPQNLDLSATLTVTNHHDKIFPSGPKGKPAPPPIDVAVSETDLHGGLSADLRPIRLSFDATQSVYNQDIAALGVRSAQIALLSGLNSTVQGFPDINASARCDLIILDHVTPYASYAYTKFKVAEPPSAAYTGGLKILWTAFTLDGSYERYAQRGSADLNYVSISASYRFGP